MLYSGILQRVNRQTLGQQWRWLALSGGLLIVCTIYLFSRDTHSITGGEYHDTHSPPTDLVATTNVNKCSLQFEGTSRLARTLQGNERRYQHMIVEREKIIEASGGMGINAFPPPHQLANLLWDFFIPAFTCPFPMYRVGTVAEGGRWICGLERVLHSRPNCLIYSLNHQTPTYSSFEEDILKRSPGCQVHAFDANITPEASSKWPWGSATDLMGSRVFFNKFSIADSTAAQHRSLQSVMRSFKHDWIDILKLDLSGAEFPTLISIISENGDAPLPFGQLILTVNVGRSDDMRTVAQFNDWFTKLECAGLRPFYFEISIMDANNRRQEPSIVYWSFINVRGRHALTDDTLPEYP